MLSALRLWRAATAATGSQAPLRTPPWSVAHQRGKKKKAKSKTPACAMPRDTPVDLIPFNENMQATVDGLRTTYSKIRSSTAAPDLLDDIAVETGGTRTPLKSMAQVASRDGRNLFITVYDERTVNDVERAVRNAGLNLNPLSEGRGILRVPVGKPSMETRNAMKELACREGEAAKVATRMVRRKAMEEVKKAKDEIGKDDMRKMEKVVQAMTERFVKEIDDMQRGKITALMDVGGRK